MVSAQETRFFERKCLLIGFDAFEAVMQELLDDCTVRIERGHPVLACYSRGNDRAYDEDEILERIGDHLGKQLTCALPLVDMEEIYFVIGKG